MYLSRVTWMHRAVSESEISDGMRIHPIPFFFSTRDKYIFVCRQSARVLILIFRKRRSAFIPHDLTERVHATPTIELRTQLSSPGDLQEAHSSVGWRLSTRTRR